MATSSNELVRFKILEVNDKLYDKKRLSFEGRIDALLQMGPKEVLVVVFNGQSTLFVLVDPESLKVLFQMKLNEKVPVNRVTHFDKTFFFAFVPCLSKKKVPSEKAYLFDTSRSSPRKCFMLSGSQIVDCCMPTPVNLFTATRPNELKFFKVAFGHQKPFVFDFTLKLEANVRSLEVFHKNNNILLANCVQSTQSSVIYIVNTLSRQIINTIYPRNGDSSGLLINSLTTVTILSKKPEIYLLGFSDGQVRICDIDSNQLDNQLLGQSQFTWNFRPQFKDLKLVKILSQNKNGNIKFVAIANQAIIIININ